MLIADLHIHSRYSRATSRDCDAPHLELWARNKGIHLVGTGDFTHPVWRKELSEMLTPAEDGLYQLKQEYRIQEGILGRAVPDPRFVVTGEISTIYKKNGKTRKVHHLILLPSLQNAESLSFKLEAIGNLHSDGRPILGLDSHDLLEILLETCPDVVYIPAHIWTPHFSVFGAFSGFDTLRECYEDLTPYVHALETGLSSDPDMNHRVSMLDGLTLVSNSDAHSPAKLGREANLLNIEPSYRAMAHAIQTGKNFAGTLEFFPEEGKYHLDGHRNCDVRLDPEETARLDGHCPVCGKKITIGVLHRVEELADRPSGFLPSGTKTFESLIPLPEVIAAATHGSVASKRTQQTYFSLLEKLGPEFHILRDLPIDAIQAVAGYPIAEGVRRLRAGQVAWQAGFDGEYGTLSLFAPDELETMGGQLSMLDVGSIAKRRAKTIQDALQKPPADENLVGKHQAAHTGPEEELPGFVPLNEQQAQAVTSTAAILAVVAGPGTGKTKTLVERIAHMIEVQGISPATITAVTFTNQAAKEMRQRIQARLGGERQLSGLTVGTFHAICLGLLDEKPIIDSGDALAFMQDILKALGSLLDPQAALGMVSAAKNGIAISKSGMDAAIEQAYRAALKSKNVRDLDDLLLDALEVGVGDQAKFTHLLVDEFQDINPIQHSLIRHWNQGSLFIIGDPDQSIYGFRGADAQCFAKLAADHSALTTVALRQNYRSTPQIVEGAEALIEHNPGGPRRIQPTKSSGAPIRTRIAEKPFDEAIWIAKEIKGMVGGLEMNSAIPSQGHRSFGEIAVLCRTRHQLDLMETCLRHESIPCIRYGRDDFLADASVLGTLGFFRHLLDFTESAALEACLHHIWKVPPTLIQRAQIWTKEHPLATPEQARAELASFEALIPWLSDLEAFAPIVHQEKPRRLLQGWVELHGKNVAMERLLNTSYFQDSMPGFLKTLLLGEDADIRRTAAGPYTLDAVKLMTVHGSKGLEFPVVFLSENAFPALGTTTDPAKIQEERRLFFVGMTRAQEELILTACDGGSLFQNEIGDHAQRGVIKPHRSQEGTEQLRFL